MVGSVQRVEQLRWRWSKAQWTLETVAALGVDVGAPQESML
jgi:hypothetical protein